MKEHGLGLKEIQSVIGQIDPLPGAKAFLDALRERTQVLILSDTFEEFAKPLMRKLCWPTILCNSLEVSPEDTITGFRMRCEQSKLTTVKALQSIGYDTIASGDSYNDLGMIRAGKAGFLFRSTEQIKADNPDIPAYETYEELQLQGLIIGAVREEAGEKLERIRKFVDKIDNWAVCDAFCGGLTFTRKNQRQVLDFLKPYVSSEREYEARFAAVMLLSWYVDAAHISETLRLLDQIWQPDYYASMAVAWAVSVCYVKFPAVTMEYLARWNTLEKDTYRRALQKILESSRADQDQKRQIRRLRDSISQRQTEKG